MTTKEKNDKDMVLELQIVDQRILENTNPDGSRKKENYIPKNGRSLQEILKTLHG